MTDVADFKIQELKQKLLLDINYKIVQRYTNATEIEITTNLDDAGKPFPLLISSETLQTLVKNNKNYYKCKVSPWAKVCLYYNTAAYDKVPFIQVYMDADFSDSACLETVYVEGSCVSDSNMFLYYTLYGFLVYFDNFATMPVELYLNVLLSPKTAFPLIDTVPSNLESIGITLSQVKTKTQSLNLLSKDRCKKVNSIKLHPNYAKALFEGYNSKFLTLNSKIQFSTCDSVVPPALSKGIDLGILIDYICNVKGLTFNYMLKTVMSFYQTMILTADSLKDDYVLTTMHGVLKLGQYTPHAYTVLTSAELQQYKKQDKYTSEVMYVTYKELLQGLNWADLKTKDRATALVHKFLRLFTNCLSRTTFIYKENFPLDLALLVMLHLYHIDSGQAMRSLTSLENKYTAKKIAKLQDSYKTIYETYIDMLEVCVLSVMATPEIRKKLGGK